MLVPLVAPDGACGIDSGGNSGAAGDARLEGISQSKSMYDFVKIESRFNKIVLKRMFDFVKIESSFNKIV